MWSQKMLSLSQCDQIDHEWTDPKYCILEGNLLIAIIWLMLTVCFGPKVITLSKFTFSSKWLSYLDNTSVNYYKMILLLSNQNH
jgi:hypothetical protein